MFWCGVAVAREWGVSCVVACCSSDRLTPLSHHTRREKKMARAQTPDTRTPARCVEHCSHEMIECHYWLLAGWKDGSK